MTLEDIATVGVETAGPDATVEVLASTMARKDVGSVVVERDREPIGLVTDRDLAVRVLGAGEDPSALTARDVMSPYPTTVHVDDDVLDATEAMCEHAVRRLPVVADEGEVVGIVTLDDLTRLLAAELGNLADVIAAESPP